MTIHCVHCGTELPDIANFCLICGKPPRGGTFTQASHRQEVEYKEVIFDISVPKIKYKTLNEFEDAKKIAHQRVHEVIKPYLAQGWVLDGPFDSAVDIHWQRKGTDWLSGYDIYVLRDVSVRFRRYL